MKIRSLHPRSLDLRSPYLLRALSTVAIALGTITSGLPIQVAVAQGQIAGTCSLSAAAIAQKADRLQAALQGDQAAASQYRTLVAEDTERLIQCRGRNWPQVQAMWLRLYPCDLKPGVLDRLMDQIASRGYNRVYIEVFYDGQVLLPASRNPTVWLPVARNPEFADRDLLAEAILKARQRGLSPYAWVFGLNFGYPYGLRSDRQSALARNGTGQTSLNISEGPNGADRAGDVDKVFVDPYSPQAKEDYAQMLQEVLKRQPDGVLIDYIRYIKQRGGESVADSVKDLWIYSPASQQALYNRSSNRKGQEVIQRYLTQGTVSAQDLATLDQQYPQEPEPLWQGRNVPAVVKGKPKPRIPAEQRLIRLRQELWLLSVAHAYQGVVDFLSWATTNIRQQRIAAGAVFFPEGNRRIKGGFDSRMQPWDQFPNDIEWHPMVYAACGQSQCIVDQVKEVAGKAIASTVVSPVLVGVWGQASENRPSLDDQMAAIRQALPSINSVSHFDFSRQDPKFTNERRSCTVK
jgi:hypothetical protein